MATRAADTEGCLPCELEHAEDAAVVYRDADWACEVAEGYDVPGWFILRSRRHAEGWAGLVPSEVATFGAVGRRVAEAVRAATNAPKVYFLSFGENYSHFHFLVIARHAELAAELRGAAILQLRTDHRNLAAARATAADVRRALATD